MKKSKRATRFFVTALVLGTTGSAASCLRVNDSHCMFNGGDTACGDDRYCVAAVAGGSVVVDADGCADQEMTLDGRSTAETGLACLKYGLVESQADLEAQLGSGIQGCSDWPPADLPALLMAVEGIELDLRSRGRASREAAALSVTQGDAINTLVLAVQSAEQLCSDDTTTGTMTTMEGTSTTADSETDNESTTTGDEPCMSDEDCSSGAPFCNLVDPKMGVCVVTCDDMPDPHAACEAMNSALPVCEAGVCVQCTLAMPEECINPTPVCDPDTNTCVTCTAHEQCGMAACNLFTGACLPDDEDHVVPMVRGQTLTEALALIQGQEGTLVVPAGAVYDESVTVEDGQVIAFRAAELGLGIDPPRWVRNSGNTPQLTVNGGGTVLLDGMQLSLNSSSMVPGLLVDGGQACLERSRVVDNNGGDIVAQAEGELVLHNCFVGGDVNDQDAVTVSSATATIVYSTLGAGFGTATALTCDAASTVTVRNSLLVSRSTDPEVGCAGATIEHSAAEMSLGGTNTDLLDMNTNWFANYGVSDFHLAPFAPVALDTAARWRLGDPPTDIDGEPRPMTDDTSDVAGADVP